jgi:O-antigen ligase
MVSINAKVGMTVERSGKFFTRLSIVFLSGYYIVAPFNNRFYYGLSLIAFLLAIYAYVQNRERLSIELKSHVIVLFLFLGYIALSAAWSPEPAHTISALLTIGAFSITYFTALVISTTEKPIFLLAYFPLTSLIICLFFLYFLDEYGSIRHFSFVYASETPVTYGNVGLSGLIISTPFIYMLALEGRISCLLLLVASAYFCLTGTFRFAIISFSITFVLSILLVRGPERKRLVYLSFLVVFLLIAWWGWVESESFAGGLDATLKRFDERDEIREHAFDIALENFMENPVLGTGFNSTPSIAESRQGFPYQAHSLLVTLASEGGILLFVMYSILVLQLIYRLVRAARFSPIPRDRIFYRATLVSIFAYFLCSMFQPLLFIPHFYVLLAIPFSRRTTQN